VEAFRVMREEVDNAPVFLNVGFWVWFERMHHIRKLHPITHKKYWEVVSNKIKVSLQKENG
jgi:hypothetical protein